MEVKKLERGWPGHYICSDRCMFRRNTLLSYRNNNIVVSTVGLLKIDGKFETVGIKRYFETMCFYAGNNKYKDADVSKEISFDSKWQINKIDAEIEANEMHENVVKEIIEKMEKELL